MNLIYFALTIKESTIFTVNKEDEEQGEGGLK
jgi:hypothetical protein